MNSGVYRICRVGQCQQYAQQSGSNLKSGMIREREKELKKFQVKGHWSAVSEMGELVT